MKSYMDIHIVVKFILIKGKKSEKYFFLYECDSKLLRKVNR